MKISVIISTKNRTKELRMCLMTILRNTFTQFEIILIDQSTNNETKVMVKQFASKRIRYRHTDRSGQTIGINIGIRMAKGDIYVFTDDDYVIPRTWLSTIHKTYKRLSYIDGLSGQVLPYTPTKSKKHCVCPALYQSKKERLITTVGPTVHSSENGFGKGANMSFRKEVVDTLGGFKEWLGPGAKGASAGNETEFIYRAIRNKFQLYFLPALVVYHNRWLTKQESESLRSTKIQGYTAFITYHMIKNLDVSLFDGLFRFRWLCMPTIKAFIHLLFGKSRLTPEDVDSFRLSYGLAKGITIGAFYAIRDVVTFR